MGMGRNALVTGAASGIGAACAMLLAERGVGRLVLVDLDGAALDALDLPGCEVLRFIGDVADPALWERIEVEAGPLDHAVLNAGIGRGAPIANLSFETWRELMTVNLDGMFLSLKTALRLAADGASLVLTASVAGIKPEIGNAAYSTSKAAVIQLAKVAAKEGAARGIRVNAIAPGGVDTPIWDKMPFFAGIVAQHGGDRAEALAAMGKGTPLGRFASAAEIAAQVAFLLSDDAATITGTVLVSDGGYLL
ncbi:SDR family oxidoreductase [Altererythrobacter salegens]|uniref:SDR family oxidoreductase n=1 Tax=Croceibacterium salegens TaxID=1737568 RepID=A0A6I4SY09_9SPHN|nr:SDR family NAD(P)-dependent oxidoreductase [Croceibacterium salegens]MXO60974.1 SDR family oxidoreductase [Croceibacterium salegens]